MLFLAANGYRCIAHDRRGHGRSTQTWDGNEMDTYADDLATLIETLDLRDVTLVGFSTGGGEVARYIGRHGTDRVAKVALVSAVPPLMVQRDDNPGGVPIEVFDGIRLGSLTDRSPGSRRPHTRHPRRRRPGRPLRGRRQGFRRAGGRSDAHRLRRGTARDHRHPQGPPRPRPARLRQGVTTGGEEIVGGQQRRRQRHRDPRERLSAWSSGPVRCVRLPPELGYFLPCLDRKPARVSDVHPAPPGDRHSSDGDEEKEQDVRPDDAAALR